MSNYSSTDETSYATFLLAIWLTCQKTKPPSQADGDFRENCLTIGFKTYGSILRENCENGRIMLHCKVMDNEIVIYYFMESTYVYIIGVNVVGSRSSVKSDSGGFYSSDIEISVFQSVLFKVFFTFLQNL